MDQFLVEQCSFGEIVSFWWNKSVLGEIDLFLVERISHWRNGETKKFKWKEALFGGTYHLLVERISFWSWKHDKSKISF